ncbi:MAG: T9SS type A sorting domain-containing protein [Flavobacteriales bacterium]|nr:T9SS type A sorting domain-containing protein [Flavobacteriales bacterium]
MKKLILLSLFVFAVKASFAALIGISAVTNPTCFDVCDGEIEITVTGGTAPYTYVWSNVQTNEDLANLCSGTYTITITDDIGTSIILTETLIEPVEILLTTVQVRQCTCEQSNGEGLVTVTQGLGGWDYLWSANATQTSASLLNVPSGPYEVTVTSQATGCTATAPLPMTDEQAPVLTIIDFNDATCFGLCDGNAVATVFGGRPPYSFQWYSGPDLVNDIIIGEEALSIASLCAGVEYTIGITDDTGCYAYNTVTVGGPTAVVAGIPAPVDALCQDSCDGSARVIVTGGTVTGDYTYQWSDILGQTTAEATGLCKGNYIVNVEDDNGCVTTASTDIDDPDPIVVTIIEIAPSLCGDFTGVASASGVGGDNVFTYRWSDDQVSATATDLNNSNYTVTLTDGNGCIGTQVELIDYLAGPVIQISDVVNPYCAAACDGEIEVNSPQGQLPHTYLWSDVSAQTTQRAVGLCAGTYTVTLVDGNGCEDTEEYTLTDPAAVFASITITDETTSGNADGTATVLAGGGTAPYTYNWTSAGNQTSGTITGLTPGEYCCVVTDANGCITNACGDVKISTGINELSASNIISTSYNQITINAAKGQVEVYSLTGKRVYKGNLNANNNAISLREGIYLVKVNSKGQQHTRKVYLSGN